MEVALKKKLYPSTAQKTRLIALLEADEELRSGKFSASFTKKEGERRWVAIAQDLNSIPGSKREWKEWRKTWQDMKAAAKRKSAACRYSSTSTGGGTPAPPLSEENIAVLSTISTNAVFGHEDCKESTVKFEDVPTYMSAEADIVVALINEDHSKPSSANPSAAGKGIVMALHQDLPCTSSMQCRAVLKETRTDQVPETTANDNKTGSDADKENRSTTKPIKRTKRRAAVRRLDHSLALSESVKSLMKEKLELKKKFYDCVITEMRAQTEILKNISENIRALP